MSNSQSTTAVVLKFDSESRSEFNALLQVLPSGVLTLENWNPSSNRGTISGPLGAAFQKIGVSRFQFQHQNFNIRISTCTDYQTLNYVIVN